MSKYMATLQQDPAFQQAIAEAQKKFQALMQDPKKLEELQKQYAGILPAGAGGSGDGEKAAEGSADAAVDKLSAEAEQLSVDG